VEELKETYAVYYSNAVVLVLNHYVWTNKLVANQRWVDAVLATNIQPHVFALGHTAAFSVQHTDCLGFYPELRNALWRSLISAGLRMFFCGHDHFYDHARIDDGDGDPDNDGHQFVVGTGGAAFYPDSTYDSDNGPWKPTRVFHEENYGYVLVDVDGDTVNCTWKRRAGPGVFEPGGDEFTYALRPRLRLLSTGEHFSVHWNGQGRLEQASHPNGPYTQIEGAVSPYALTNFTPNSVYFRVLVR
jgi:hypothetical protein